MLNSAYCTVDEANTINNSSAWNVLTRSEKQYALDWGRVYLDRSYSCALDFDNLNAINDAEVINAYKAANAVLGDKYANNVLFEASPTGGQRIAEKAVKAGSVSTRTRYAEPVTGATYDPYPEVSALLDGICSRKSSDWGMHPVIRG